MSVSEAVDGAVRNLGDKIRSADSTEDVSNLTKDGETNRSILIGIVSGVGVGVLALFYIAFKKPSSSGSSSSSMGFNTGFLSGARNFGTSGYNKLH